MANTPTLARGIQDHPPLPEVLLAAAGRRAIGERVLADGCYFVACGPIELPIFFGTLRVDSRAGNLSASADLYENPLAADSPPIGSMPPLGSGIPIFPIQDYRLYLRITKIEPTETGFSIAFDAHRFFLQSFITLAGENTQWMFDGSYSADMKPAIPPAGYPKPEFFFVGDFSKVSENDSIDIGQMQIGWVSSALRRAVVEIDRVPCANVPLDNGAGTDWCNVFQSFGWDIKPIIGNDDVTKNGDSPWTRGDAEAARQEYEDATSLDTEWRYYILVASLITAQGSNFGWMYDTATRKALFMASQYVFPETEAKWGKLRGERFDTTVAFFRTALHEMGHAMGLGHNSLGNHFMRPTEDIADSASADSPFPENIKWSFDPNDLHRLRHWPDITVRPGGAGYNELKPLLPRRTQAPSAE